MKNIIVLFLVVLLILGCTTSNEKEIAQIRLHYQFVRLDSLLFTVDTNTLSESIQKLYIQYPNILNNYLYFILQMDTSAAGIQNRNNDIKLFIRMYKSLYDSTKNRLGDLHQEKQDLYEAFQHMKYYCPGYIVPSIFTYIASFNGLGIAVFPKNEIGIGMQMFLGNNFAFYQTIEFGTIFPQYISQRFDRKYMVRTCIDEAIRDLFPTQKEQLPLIERMVIEGRYWYVLKKILPNTADTIITQYTKKQLDWCLANERNIWQFVLAQNKNLYTKDLQTTSMYLGDAPFTQIIGNMSPGNIGAWIGMRIVDSYMQQQKLSLSELMQKNPSHIFQQSKYLY